jgi:AcrR family transcriptional regulator
MNHRAGKPRATTRDRILATAGSLFAEHGFDAVSVRDIVRAARVNLGAITYYFGSKEALLGEVVLAKVAPLRETGQRILESERRPDDKLRAMLEAYAFFVLNQEPGLKVLFAEILSGGGRLPAAAVESVLWRNRVTQAVLREGIRQGIFRRCDVECAAWVFFGMLAAYVLEQPLLHRADRHGAYPRRYVRRIVDAALDVFMNGVRSQAEAGGGARRRKAE